MVKDKKKNHQYRNIGIIVIVTFSLFMLVNTSAINPGDNATSIWRSIANGNVSSIDFNGDYLADGNLNITENSTSELIKIGNNAWVGYNSTCQMIFYNQTGGVMSTLGCS